MFNEKVVPDIYRKIEDRIRLKNAKEDVTKFMGMKTKLLKNRFWALNSSFNGNPNKFYKYF